jgi:hypothetical protein
LNREYLEDYRQKEWDEWHSFIRRMNQSNFCFGKERYPADQRFCKIQQPVTIMSPYGINGTDEILSQVPFCGSLVVEVLPISKPEFEKTFFRISEIQYHSQLT